MSSAAAGSTTADRGRRARATEGPAIFTCTSSECTGMPRQGVSFLALLAACPRADRIARLQPDDTDGGAPSSLADADLSNSYLVSRVLHSS